MNDETQEDPALTTEQEKLVQKLSREDLDAIDKALIENVCGYWRKVARVVGTTIVGFEGEFKGIPDVFFAQRIQQFAKNGLIESQGNLNKMKYSEIRFPKSEIDEKS